MDRRFLGRTLLAVAGLSLLLAPVVRVGAMPPDGKGLLGEHGGHGQPLVSEELAVGELTVKVVGDSIADARVGLQVELVLADGATRKPFAKGKTNARGRARFSGLTPGKTYVARFALDSGRVVRSQLIRCPARGGVRVLLSAAQGAGRASAAQPPRPDSARQRAVASGHGRGQASKSGDARVSLDRTLKPGTLRISVRRGRKPVAGAEVVVVRGGTRRAGQTDRHGRFQVLLSVKDAALTAEVSYRGVRYATDRLRTVDGGGLSIAFGVFEKTRDSSVLRFGEGSHVLGEVRDGELSIVQVLMLINASDRVFDPGPAGVAIPYPEGARPGAIPDEMKRYLRPSPDRKGVVLYRPVLPGQTRLRIGYALPYDGPLVEFRQRAPFRFDTSLLAVTNTRRPVLHGPAVVRRELRETSGGKVAVFVLAPVAAGKALELTIDALPYRERWPIHVVLGLCVLLLLWALFEVFAGNRAHVDRKGQREQLLRELVQLTVEHEKGAIQQKSFDKQQQALLAKLERIWED